jgi:AsmA protein
MRIFRLVAIVVGALLALVIVALVAVLIFVDPNRYRGDIERIAHEQTARVLTIRGPLHLKIFPWLALSVNDVQLSNRAGFGDQPFMTVQNASIGVKVLPLLSKRIEVSRIALEGVHLNLASRGEENNWKDLGGSEKPGETPASSSTSGGSLSIEGVDLTKAFLAYRDELKKSTTEISDLELHTGRLERGPTRTALASAKLQGTYVARSEEQPSPGNAASAPLAPLPFSLHTSALTLDRTSDTLAPAKVELKVGDTALVISVSGEKMSTRRPSTEGTRGRESQTSAEPATSQRLVTGNITVPTTSPRKLLQSLGIAPPVTRDPKALSAFGLQTNFRLTQKQLQLSALQLSLDDTRVEGAASIEDLDSSAMSFDLAVNAINLDRYRAPVPPVDKAAAAAAKRSPPPPTPPTPLPIETLRKLNAHGSLRVGSATLSNLLLTDVVLPLAAKDGRVRLGPTQAHLYGGSYNGDIVLDAGPAQAQLSLNEHVRGTDIGALFKAALDSTRLSGHADLNVVAAGVGNTDEAMKRSLSGKFDANVKQGAFIGIDMGYELQRVNALVKRQVPPQHSGPARTVFNVLETSGTIDKGILHIDPLRMETDFLKVHGGGTLDTATEGINYQLVASSSGLDALKSVEVPLTIKGTLSSPAVRPDIEALAKGKLGQEVQQKAGELVKKKLGDKLKDLFGR